MKSSQTITFGEFFGTLGDVAPYNVEHFQARAKHIHDVAVLIVADESLPFSKDARVSFPLAENFHLKSDTAIAIWWGKFSLWFDALPMDQWRLLNDSPVTLV